MMGNREVIEAALQAMEAGDIDGFGSYLSDDFTAAGPTVELDKPTTLAYLQMLLTAFPDIRYHFDDIEVDGDIIQVKGQEAGTHTGVLDLNPFGIPLTLPPTGKSISLPVTLHEYVLREGQIIRMKEHVTEGGGLRGALKQLGVDL